MPDLTGLPPIYPVVLGRADAIRTCYSAGLSDPNCIRGCASSIQADVAVEGYSGDSIVCQVLNQEGKKVTSRPCARARTATNSPFAFNSGQKNLDCRFTDFGWVCG